MTQSAPTSAERPKYTPPSREDRVFGQGVIETSVSFGPSLKRLLGNLRPERLTVLFATLLAVAGVVMSALGPAMLGQGTDIIFAGVTHRTSISGNGIDFFALRRILLIALGLYVVSGLCLWLQGKLLNGAVQRTIFAMRYQIETKINRVPLSYLDKMARGEILSRVTSDIDNVAQAMQQTLSQALQAVLTVIGVTMMMFVVSPLLALVAFLTIPVSLIASRFIGKYSQKEFVNQWKNVGELNTLIEETFTGHMLVKLFGHRADAEARFAAKNEELFNAGFRGQFISSLIMPATMVIGNLNYAAVAVVGGIRVASGAISLGSVQAFIQYLGMFTQPLAQLASMANLLQSGVASAERIFEVLDAPEESADEQGALLPTRGRVVFEHVSFAYDPKKPLITNLSLVAEPGHTIAIVGPTGAGKTTLVNLVMRFYELDAGRILLDGVDISAVPRDDLRENIGMVLQDTWLFHGTIYENIAYGRPTATDAEIRKAAEATYVDRFVHSLPAGYDTIIDEEATNISAGEKQLITIARAFLANPALLILDEATSSIDTRTEVLVQRAMAALRSDRTSFVIAHRLSTIRDADTILIMENGSIVEQGSHAQLLDAKGHYFALYNSQFSEEA